MQGDLTPQIVFWVFESPVGFHFPTFGSVSCILTLGPKVGLRHKSWTYILSKLSMHSIIPKPLKVIKLSLHYQSTIFNDIKLFNDRDQMTIKHNIHDTIWFKNVTCDRSSICNLMCSITKNCEIIGNIINHFGRVTIITNMVVVNVPFDIIIFLEGTIIWRH